MLSLFVLLNLLHIVGCLLLRFFIVVIRVCGFELSICLFS